MPDFKVVSEYQPAGDQPQAIDKLAAGLENGLREQVLKGVTGSGKTYTMAKVIERVNRPTLVLAHNKTLAAQLCEEYRRTCQRWQTSHFRAIVWLPSPDHRIETERPPLPTADADSR